MIIRNIKNNIQNIKHSLDFITKNNLSLRLGKEKQDIMDFKNNKSIYYQNLISTNIRLLHVNSLKLDNSFDDELKVKMVGLVRSIDESYKKGDAAELNIRIDEIVSVLSGIKVREKIISKSNIPVEIKEDVIADVEEIYNCFNSECYRSVVILCGRVLETVLHRLYYQTTGNDLLEKSPGIGLGKIIAKLEGRYHLDPALKQQIHLINQIRVFSVHKKKEVFYPSKAQAQAIMLYTKDILEKVF